MFIITVKVIIKKWRTYSRDFPFDIQCVRYCLPLAQSIVIFRIIVFINDMSKIFFYC